MIKSKAQEIFRESLKKLNQIIYNLDKNLGLNSNLPNIQLECQMNCKSSIPSNIKIEEEKTPIKVPKKTENKPKEDPLISLFNDVDLRVGKVLEIKNKENSEEIYLLKIDLGEGSHRNIGTGLRKYVSPEEFLGKNVLVFANLKPKKLGDFVSEGMVLCSYNEDETKFELPRPHQGNL